jgi:superfamily II DNA/RNA helicase
MFRLVRRYTTVVPITSPVAKNKMKSFQEIPGLHDELQSLLRRSNIHKPSIIQEIALPKVLDFKSGIVTAECGTGKSLVYLLSILNSYLNGTHKGDKYFPDAVIIVPSTELTLQCEAFLKNLISNYENNPFKEAQAFDKLKIYTLNKFSKGDCTLYFNQFSEAEKLIKMYLECRCNLANIERLAQFHEELTPNVVITTSRLLANYFGESNIQNFLSHVSTIVIDEYDMIMQGSEKEYLQNVILACRRLPKNKDLICEKAEREQKLKHSIDRGNTILQKIISDEAARKKHNIKRLPDIQEISYPEVYKPLLPNYEKERQLIFTTASFDKAKHEAREKPLRGSHIPLPVIESPLTNIVRLSKQEYIYFSDEDKVSRLETLSKVLQEEMKREKSKIIIFCNHAIPSQEVYDYLLDRKFPGLSAFHLNSNISTLERIYVLKTFVRHFELPKIDSASGKFDLKDTLNSSSPKETAYNVLICTDIMARGIDFQDFNLVIQYDFAFNAISYLHRVGRVSRMNAAVIGKVVNFVTPKFHHLATAIEMKTSQSAVNEQSLRDIFDFNKKEKELRRKTKSAVQGSKVEIDWKYLKRRQVE